MDRTPKALMAACAAAGLVIAGFALMSPASADPDPDLHCDGHNVAPNVKDESGANDNDLVPPEGTLICVKASTGNTGVIVADGETTLREYLFNAGIVDGSGYKGRDVSYWVTYPPGTTTTVPDDDEPTTTTEGDDEPTTTTTEGEETTTTTEGTTTTTTPPEIIPPVVVVPPGAPEPVEAPPDFTG